MNFGRQGTRGRPRDLGGGGTWTRGVEGGWVNIYPPPQTTRHHHTFTRNKNNSHPLHIHPSALVQSHPRRPLSPLRTLRETRIITTKPPSLLSAPTSPVQLSPLPPPLPHIPPKKKPPIAGGLPKNFPSRAGCSLRRFLPGFLTSVTLTTLHRLQEVNRLRHHPHLLFQPSLTLFQRSNVRK